MNHIPPLGQPMQDIMQMPGRPDAAQGMLSLNALEAVMGSMPRDMMETMFCNTRDKGAQNDTAFRQTVRHTGQAGATGQHIALTIRQMSVFAGLPAVTRALKPAQGVPSAAYDTSIDTDPTKDAGL